MAEDRPPRNPAVRAEEAVLGSAGTSRMRRVGGGDSSAITHANMKVYLLRVATLTARGREGEFELGWKSARGSVDARRIEDSTPIFAEMAVPGTTFTGAWQERSVGDRTKLFQAANRYAAAVIARHKEYSGWAGLSRLGSTLDELAARLESLRSRPDVCLLPLGWGGGFLGKSAYLDTQEDSYRKILRNIPLYQRAIQTGLPFPKTRRVVFHENQPASLPGWVALEVF
jgi:CRISPR-associated protein Csm5